MQFRWIDQNHYHLIEDRDAKFIPSMKYRDNYLLKV